MIKEELTTEEEKFYTGKVDRVFKTIFVNDNNFKLMEAVLNECLGSKVKIIKYLYPELGVINVSDKVKRTDVLIELDGKNVILEINTEGEWIRLRNFNYFTTFYSTRIKRGEDYFDSTDHILIDLSYGLGTKGKMINEYNMQNEEGDKYVENFRIIEFNMDKMMKECYDKIIKGESEQYKYLVMLSLGKEDLAKLSKKDNIVKEYMDRLVELNNDKEFRYIVSQEEDAKLTEKLLQDCAKKEGIQEGIEKGVRQGIEQGSKEEKIKIAKNMLLKNYDIDTIADLSGLSKEEIKKLK